MRIILRLLFTQEENGVDTELFIFASFVVLDFLFEVVKCQVLLTTESQTPDPLDFRYIFIFSLHDK
jgi:hypothetical protein